MAPQALFAAESEQSMARQDLFAAASKRSIAPNDRKHNQANGEENRDGCDDNRSWNGGAEGETDDPAIRENRLRRAKSLFLTLALAKGIPMIVAGDERWRTQDGNNNPLLAAARY